MEAFRVLLKYRCLTKRLSKLILSYHLNEARYFSSSMVLFSFNSYRPPPKPKKRMVVESVTDSEEVCITEEENKRLDGLLEKTLLPAYSGHQVFVVQPYIKWGVRKKRNTTPELQLLEAVTLIKTLRTWKIVDKTIISLQRVRLNTIFGSGQVEELKSKILKNKYISAVFISINSLTLYQQKVLEDAFGVPVFDRYSIVMLIFKEHAHSKEAKLQVQLAQLPYLWTVLKGVNEGVNKKFGLSGSYIGGEGPQLLSVRKEVFKAREAKIRKEIKQLRENRLSLRKEKEKKEFPVVAVIGYTNAGKTSIIKAMTGKESLDPQDYLFATLDVTSYLGVLPSGLKAYFVDTLGFISDIPTYLIESFISTLEDVTFAHVIVHVRDISHPDTVAQNENVIQTLEDLNLSEESIKNIITVGNKIDLLDDEQLKQYKDLILVSSTQQIGIDVLRLEIEKKILQECELTRIIIRVETGSEEYNWLLSNSTVGKQTPDPKNNQYILVETIISSSNLAKFKHHFITNYKK